MNGNSYKERYFKDYHIEKVPAKNGKAARSVYVYHGSYCSWEQYGVLLDYKELMRRKAGYALLICSEIVLYSAASLQRGIVNSSGWTALTGGLSIVALLYQIISVVRFCFAKTEMKQLDAEEIHKYIRGASAIHALLLMSATLFGIVAALEAAAFSESLLALLLYLLSAICSLILFLLQQRIEPTVLQK